MNKHIKHLPRSMKTRGPDGQASLPLVIETERDVNGIGMGILSDGTPFLTQRGLAALCGVQNAHIGTTTHEWSRDPPPPRVVTIKRILSEGGPILATPHLVVRRKAAGGGVVFAYTDRVCLAFLEYYAYEAGQQCQPEALRNFRRLARESLKDLVYRELGYTPEPKIPLAWQQFHDRVTVNHDAVPKGYFSVFKELADLIVTLIRAGANFGPEFVPDISVGRAWADQWSAFKLDDKYGSRVRYNHSYPDYFPQSSSNPQLAFCYPNTALAEYRAWMEDVYLKDRLQPYLRNAEKRGALPPSFTDSAMRAIAARSQPKLLA